MYKEFIFKTLSNYPTHQGETAEEGASYLFNKLQKDLPDKVYALYLNELRSGFFHQYHFDKGESFTNGFLLARYFLLRGFKLSYEEFYNYLETEKKNKPFIKVNTTRVIA
jgi:hypothetical protein